MDQQRVVVAFSGRTIVIAFSEHLANPGFGKRREAVVLLRKCICRHSRDITFQVAQLNGQMLAAARSMLLTQVGTVAIRRPA